jgi:hypothetical protein
MESFLIKIFCNLSTHLQMVVVVTKNPKVEMKEQNESLVREDLTGIALSLMKMA